MGFSDTIGNPPSNGIFFSNVSTTTAANWNGFAKIPSGSTPSGGSTPLDTVFHTFEIQNDGQNNITFWLDGAQYGSTVTSNVPAGVLQPFLQIINTEAQTKLLDIDAFQFTMTVNR